MFEMDIDAGEAGSEGRSSSSNGEDSGYGHLQRESHPGGIRGLPTESVGLGLKLQAPTLGFFPVVREVSME